MFSLHPSPRGQIWGTLELLSEYSVVRVVVAVAFVGGCRCDGDGDLILVLSIRNDQVSVVLCVVRKLNVVRQGM